jgi:serine/threonine-protein phosphatase 2B regulatory subunit
VSLYHRFCQLDRNGGGFVSAEEFMTVPEFAVNPLSQVRLLAIQDIASLFLSMPFLVLY